MNERVWVNFKELRARLRFDEVLRLYNVEVKSKGEQHHGPCPLPGHTGSRDKPCFSANLKRGIFHCFGCGAKGNVLEFAALMEKADIKDGVAIRKVAVSLQQRFFPEGASRRHRPVPDASGERPAAGTPPRAEPPVAAEMGPEVLVNQPMDFELRGLDRTHEYFARHGLTAATAEHFGLGFCIRGLLKDRIAIPLHDDEGELIGYSGRLVDDSRAGDENPLYLFPQRRERQGRVLGFQRSLFLYNAHRLEAGLERLVVVGWFPSVWWLTQAGVKDVVATMGPTCSDAQAEIVVNLVRPDGRVWIMPDGNADGEALAISLLERISPHRPVRWARLTDGHRPTDLAPDELTARFAS